MFCENCGFELENNEKFCPKCGTAVEEVPGEQKDEIVGEVAEVAEVAEVTEVAEVAATEVVEEVGIEEETIKESIPTPPPIPPVVSVPPVVSTPSKTNEVVEPVIAKPEKTKVEKAPKKVKEPKVKKTKKVKEVDVSIEVSGAEAMPPVKSISTIGYIFMMLFMLIPGVNILTFFVLLASKNLNKKHFAIAAIILFFIIVGLLVAGFFMYQDLYYDINDAVYYYFH